MLDITPESPAAALWPDGEGGLTGARARKRLEGAGIATVGDLASMDAQDIAGIPRAGKGVLAEVRRALTARGLRLTGDPVPHAAAIRDAQAKGRAEAARAADRTRALREDDAPATAENFAALVADLRAELGAADAEQARRLLATPRLQTPRSLTGRAWAWAPVGPQGASSLTGYSAATIRAYAARAKREHAAGEATERTMPLPQDGRWVPADLAVWMATRNEGQAGAYEAGPERHRAARRETSLIPQTIAAAGAIRVRDGRVDYHALAREMSVDYRTAVHRAAVAGVASDLATETAGDAEVTAWLTAALASTRRYLTLEALLGGLHEAGIPAGASQTRRLLPQLRAAERRRPGAPAGSGRAPGESLHPQGWLSASEVAGDWGVAPGAITAAIRRGDVRVAGRGHGRTWIDPARLRGRADAVRTPVDMSHPKAVPADGQRGG